MRCFIQIVGMPRVWFRVGGMLLALALCGRGGARGQKVEMREPLGDISARMGGGNFTNGDVGANERRQFAVLETLDAHACRINLYPGKYLVNNDWNRPNIHALDNILLLAHTRNVTPLLLFEFYSDYILKNNMAAGSEAQWAGLGRAFAERYRPNGAWARENRIKDWGITIYTAFNEPDGGDFKAGGKLGPTQYVAALKGLSEGVHGVDKSLRVLPGGFLSANAFADWKLRGLGPALAPLWNDGHLDGMDLHTYYDVQYAPMENTYQRSAQNNFDMVKKTSGITRDIRFYSTEFNYKKRLVEEPQAARGLLTGLWDNLGVVGNDGKTPVTVIAFPWNLFNNASSDKEFGMTENSDPYTPTLRGKTLQMAMNLTRGMKFTSLDPRGKGEFVLAGAGQKLWVWQNRKAWSNHPGNAFTLTDIPSDATHITVYGWDGARKTLPIHNANTLTVTDLPGDETYLFLATRAR